MGLANDVIVGLLSLGLSKNEVLVSVKYVKDKSSSSNYCVGERLIVNQETKSVRSVVDMLNQETKSISTDMINPGVILRKETKSSSSSSSSTDHMNPLGALPFSDFGKQASDLLMKDYYNKDTMDKNFFTLGTHSNAAGIDFTLTTLKKKKNMCTRSSSSINGITIGDITTTYKSKNNKNNSIQFKIINAAAPDDGFSTTTQVHYELVPDIMNVFMSMQYPYLNRGGSSSGGSKIGCQCYIPNAPLNFTVASTLGNELPILETSAAIGTPDFAIGGDVVGDTKNRQINYRAGIRHTNSIFDMSAVVSDDTTMKVSCVHPLNLKNKRYLVAEFKKNVLKDETPTTLTVGTSFEVDHPWKEEMKTVVKAKLDNHGKVGVVLQQQLIKDSILQICSEYDTMGYNKTPRIGVSLCSIESS